jgi:hypothetical protein
LGFAAPRGRAEGGGLLNRYRVVKLYRIPPPDLISDDLSSHRTGRRDRPVEGPAGCGSEDQVREDGIQAVSHACSEKQIHELLLSKIRKSCYNNRVVGAEAARLRLGPRASKAEKKDFI